MVKNHHIFYFLPHFKKKMAKNLMTLLCFVIFSL